MVFKAINNINFFSKKEGKKEGKKEMFSVDEKCDDPKTLGLVQRKGKIIITFKILDKLYQGQF